MAREYNPTGSGSYTSEACTHCGGQVFDLSMGAPECINCFTINERAVMAAESVGCGLTQLLGVVRDLTPESKKTLLSDAVCFRVTLERIIGECHK